MPRVAAGTVALLPGRHLRHKSPVASDASAQLSSILGLGSRLFLTHCCEGVRQMTAVERRVGARGAGFRHITCTPRRHTPNFNIPFSVATSGWVAIAGVRDGAERPGRAWRATPVHELNAFSRGVTRERTQELRVEVSEDGGRTYRQLLVQEYNFSPRGATYQREEQRLNLHRVSHLRLTIVPNKNGSGTATLTSLRLFA